MCIDFLHRLGIGRHDSAQTAVTDKSPGEEKPQEAAQLWFAAFMLNNFYELSGSWGHLSLLSPLSFALNFPVLSFREGDP